VVRNQLCVHTSGRSVGSGPAWWVDAVSDVSGRNLIGKWPRPAAASGTSEYGLSSRVVCPALATNQPCRVVHGLASGTTQGTLPWSWYSDSELMRREQELIFQRGWQYAGRAEHAAEPGDYFTCSVGDVPVVVTRDRAGEQRPACAPGCSRKSS
jgi:hypothetical protein